MYNAGTEALKLGAIDEAIGILERVALRTSEPLLGSRAWANLGVGLRRQDRQKEAVRAFSQALRMDPESAHARFNLANTLKALGEYTEALEHYTQLHSAFPERWDVSNNMGAVFMALGQPSEAAACFSDALASSPDDSRIWGNLGTAQAAAGRSLAPLRSLLQALKLDPRSSQNHIRVGHLLAEQGHLDTARKAFASAARLDPESSRAATGLAQVLHRQGQNEAALRLIKPLVEGGSTHPNLIATWTQICRQTQQPEAALAPLQAQISTATAPATLSFLHHCLGDVLSDLHRYDEAFAAHARANHRRQAPHDPDAHSAWVDQLIRQPLHPVGSSEQSEVPVLIVGMPRSGTSLVEQILSAHASIHGAGEMSELRQLTLMAQQTLQIPYPACLPALTPEQLDQMATGYLSRLCRDAPDALRVTDKLPQNFLFLGLVSAMLPRARVIHCVRDPADTALSCFFQNFKDTLNFTADLDWLAQWTRDYQRLMAHWHKVLPLPILDVPYAGVCREPERWTRKILDFMGLDWDPACLQAHSHSRVVRTASYAQVQRPIYTTSIGRADAYASHIPGLMALRDSTELQAPSSKSDERPMTQPTGGPYG
jgi:tetratricopeptide (TPR) repeat protein